MKLWKMQPNFSPQRHFYYVDIPVVFYGKQRVQFGLRNHVDNPAKNMILGNFKMADVVYRNVSPV